MVVLHRGAMDECLDAMALVSRCQYDETGNGFCVHSFCVSAPAFAGMLSDLKEASNRGNQV